MVARLASAAAIALGLIWSSGCASAPASQVGGLGPPGGRVDAPFAVAEEAVAEAEPGNPEATVDDGVSAPAVGEAGATAEATAADLTPPESTSTNAEEDPCIALARAGEGAIDATRRGLYRTVCGAALWFDGLFGDQRHVAAAERTSGRLELSATESEYWGPKANVRFHVRMQLPNLERHAEAFAGRDDESDFVEDRSEGFALRSQFRAIETEDRWVAGLGYSVPGSYERRTDFRVGIHGSRSPEIFVQGRHRRNWYVGDRTLWHARGTLFWTNRDGFGTTAGLDFGRVLTPTLLFRWGNVGTLSERTDGVNYRSVLVVYKNLGDNRAIAWESYVRGETDDEIPIREYGLRAVYRQPVLGRSWLFGELVGGYGWVQERLGQPREGSATVGFGIEMLFGRVDPYGSS